MVTLAVYIGQSEFFDYYCTHIFLTFLGEIVLCSVGLTEFFFVSYMQVMDTVAMARSSHGSGNLENIDNSSKDTLINTI